MNKKTSQKEIKNQEDFLNKNFDHDVDIDEHTTLGCIANTPDENEVNGHPTQQKGEYSDITLDAESLTPITSHILPTLTGLYAISAIAASDWIHASMTSYMSFLLSAGAFSLRSFSKFLSAENKNLNTSDIDTSDKKKINKLTMAHFATFVCLGLVVADRLSTVRTAENTLEKLDQEALIIAGSCLVYQMAAIGIKWAKLSLSADNSTNNHFGRTRDY